jgi:hypothetical protein
MKEFFRERFKWEEIELDEVIEPEEDEQSSAAPKNVLEAATAFMAPATTICCSHGHQSSYLTKLVVIKYSLRLILLFANTDVSTIKICLDTFVLAKSIMDRRE